MDMKTCGELTPNIHDVPEIRCAICDDKALCKAWQSKYKEQKERQEEIKPWQKL
jgi:DNA-directed RNA polymerase subunit RPC12/RpoP